MLKEKIEVLTVSQARGLSPLLRRMCAFTLCEVLITLGILGVIAEITIPDLYNNMKEQQTVGMLKKEYSTLSQAYTMAVQENGTPQNNWASSADNILQTLAPYLKINKNCATNSGCYPTGGIKDLNGNIQFSSIDASAGAGKAQLSDGSIIITHLDSSSCDVTANTNNRCGWIIVDINGLKKPNTFAKDVFLFELTNRKIIPFGTANSTNETMQDGCIGSSTYLLGVGCAAWVIYNENMDYLHCSNLSWDGPTKCQ